MDRRLVALKRLLDVMDELRVKCPWDRKQTFESLRMNTIEETYELADAILDHDLDNVKRSWAICCCMSSSIPKWAPSSRLST